MTLAERLTGERPRLRTRCVMGYWLDQADPGEHAALLAALEYRTHKRWSAEALAEVLRTEGKPVSPTTIRNHRTGVCICDRSKA